MHSPYRCLSDHAIIRFVSEGPGKKKRRTISAWIAERPEFEKDVTLRYPAHEHFSSDPWHKLLLLHLCFWEVFKLYLKAAPTVGAVTTPRSKLNSALAIYQSLAEWDILKQTGSSDDRLDGAARYL